MQTEAQGALSAAEVCQKGLKAQLAEQRRALASKEKEAGGLAQALAKEQRKVEECSKRWDTRTLVHGIACMCG